MKNTREALISGLITQINEEEQMICQHIMSYLSELGYTPHNDNVRGYVLSFKNKSVKQTIAKIGVRSGGVFYSIKFYSCKNPPQKFTGAIRDAVLKSKGQYRCSDCGVCGAAEGKRGYQFNQDGTDFVRCGAYVVEIPYMTSGDIDDFCNLLREQHAHFLARQNINT